MYYYCVFRENSFDILFAIYSTSEHRGTLEIIKDWKKVVEVLSQSDTMKKQWERYKKDNFYAEGIEYEELIDSLIRVGELLEN